GEGPRLVPRAGADRAAIHLDETDHVRALGADELGDGAQDLAVAAQVAGAGQWQGKRRSGAGGIADVVDEEADLWISEPRTRTSKASLILYVPPQPVRNRAPRLSFPLRLACAR